MLLGPPLVARAQPHVEPTHLVAQSLDVQDLGPPPVVLATFANGLSATTANLIERQLRAKVTQFPQMFRSAPLVPYRA